MVWQIWEIQAQPHHSVQPRTLQHPGRSQHTCPQFSAVLLCDCCGQWPTACVCSSMASVPTQTHGAPATKTAASNIQSITHTDGSLFLVPVLSSDLSEMLAVA